MIRRAYRASELETNIAFIVESAFENLFNAFVSNLIKSCVNELTPPHNSGQSTPERKIRRDSWSVRSEADKFEHRRVLFGDKALKSRNWQQRVFGYRMETL